MVGSADQCSFRALAQSMRSGDESMFGSSGDVQPVSIARLKNKEKTTDEQKNLEALISRNVFYQLIEESKLNSKTQELEINSGGDVFSLGKVV